MARRGRRKEKVEVERGGKKKWQEGNEKYTLNIHLINFGLINSRAFLNIFFRKVYLHCWCNGFCH